MKTQKQKQLDLLREWHDLLIDFLKKEGWVLFEEKRDWAYFTHPEGLQDFVPISICNVPKETATQKHINDCLKSYVWCNRRAESNAPIKALNRPIVWAMFSNQEAPIVAACIPFIFAANADLVIVANHGSYFDKCESLTANQYLAKKLVSDLAK